MPPAKDSPQREELRTLKLFRATLESVSQLLLALETDLSTTVSNVEVVEETSNRLRTLIKSVEEENKKGGFNKPSRALDVDMMDIDS